MGLDTISQRWFGPYCRVSLNHLTTYSYLKTKGRYLEQEPFSEFVPGFAYCNADGNQSCALTPMLVIILKDKRLYRLM